MSTLSTDYSLFEGAARYGQFYWCVKVPKTISQSGEIYVHADGVQFKSDGSLLFFTKKEYAVNLALAAGQWLAVYAASCIDGHAVAIEHWMGRSQRQITLEVHYRESNCQRS